MGFGLRIFFIDKDDNIRKIPFARFERIYARDPKEILPEYKDSRIRYAEVVVELESRKPFSIARIVYGYLQFDSNGQVDEEFLDTEGQVAINMIPSISLPGESGKVINASDKFAQKRFKNEFTWTPSTELEESIIEKTFE
jgi:hypothetical protein